MSNSTAVQAANTGGKAGRSGPPGNLNSVKHPWRSFWKRRALRSQDRWILKLVEGYQDELVSDRGGRDCVSAAELKAMEIGQAARWLLGLSEASAEGLKEAARYMSIELKSLTSVGLERRDPPAKSLNEYLASKNAAKPVEVEP